MKIAVLAGDGIGPEVTAQSVKVLRSLAGNRPELQMTEAAAMLTGSIGMLPSASMGPGTQGLFKPMHGSAPDIAVQDMANPLASILSSAMMLRHSLGLPEETGRVERAGA